MDDASNSTSWTSSHALATGAFLLIAALILCSCRPGRDVVARVGERAITTQELAYRRAVIAVRSGDEAPAHVALFQLVKEALMAEVAEEHGVVVTEAMLAQEAERVKAATRDPEALARMRNVFGKDEAAYRRLVLQPILVNQLLHARFSLSHEIQAEPLARAEEVLAAAQADPTALRELAALFRAEYRELTIEDGEIRQGGNETRPTDIPPGDLAAFGLDASAYDRSFVRQVVVGLEVGELHPRVVEDRQSFMVVRLLSHEGADAVLETVVIPKLAFDPWFRLESRQVSLVVNDEGLRESLLAEVDVPYVTDRLARAGSE